jgi:hypothetical protein
MLHDLTIKSDPSNSTGTVDETPVATQDVAETLVRNYGICHENSTTLSSLQEWVREQSLVR